LFGEPFPALVTLFAVLLFTSAAITSDGAAFGLTDK
jgi:hypothetical protein